MSTKDIHVQKFYWQERILNGCRQEDSPLPMTLGSIAHICSTTCPYVCYFLWQVVTAWDGWDHVVVESTDSIMSAVCHDGESVVDGYCTQELHCIETWSSLWIVLRFHVLSKGLFIVVVLHKVSKVEHIMVHGIYEGKIVHCFPEHDLRNFKVWNFVHSCEQLFLWFCEQ